MMGVVDVMWCSGMILAWGTRGPRFEPERSDVPFVVDSHFSCIFCFVPLVFFWHAKYCWSVTYYLSNANSHS